MARVLRWVRGLKASALGDLIHRVFAEVRLSLTQIDRWGRGYDASEWFVAPRNVIDEAINLIVSGEIVNCVYDAEAKRLVGRSQVAAVATICPC